MLEKKIYSYDECYDASLKYFDNDDLAAKVFVDKYALRDNENNLLEKTPHDMHVRIANEFARIEKNKFKEPLSFNQIYNLLDHFKYIVPQGSPMYGIGNNYQTISLSNCYLLEVPMDSYNSILDVDKQLVNISKRRGGVGIDLSNLRPNGIATKNAARTSTGITAFMERYSNSIREVGQAGRRGALMLTLSVHHPDIIGFIKIKQDRKKVTGANISVRLSKEFLDAVEIDGDYELKFPVDSDAPIFSKKIKAKEVWKEIITAARDNAEPGILAWHNVTLNTPADYYEEYKSRGTNPCSELNLSQLDSCRLLLLNLYSYVKNQFTKNAYFDFDLFKQHSKYAQRLMDDMVDLESEKIDGILSKIDADPEPEETKDSERKMWNKIKKHNNEGRRTGTGITALGDCLAALGIGYGTDASIEMSEKIYRCLKLSAYEESVDMAEEIGPFACWDYEKESNCPFIQRIAEEDPILFSKMKKFGRRNISLLTTAPAGTVSIETQTTSGIEPLFMMSYTRRKKINHADKTARVDFVDQSGDAWQEFIVYHEKIKEWMKITGETDVNKSPWAGHCAEDINWINRVKLQAAAQKHICHSISSTLNLPEDVSCETVATIYETAFKAGCKGMTIYRKNCRTGVLVENNKKDDEPIRGNVIKKNLAPVRPSALPCEIHKVKVKGNEYFVIVGLLNDEPYEIFAGDIDGLNIVHQKGTLTKLKRGSYKAKFENGTTIDSVADYISGTEEAIARLVSTSLRHGSDISFIVHQLEKARGDMLSFEKAIARTLKKYIKNGTKVYGEKCNCGGENLIRESGCVICKDCGWSACK